MVLFAGWLPRAAWLHAEDRNWASPLWCLALALFCLWIGIPPMMWWWFLVALVPAYETYRSRSWSRRIFYGVGALGLLLKALHL